MPAFAAGLEASPSLKDDQIKRWHFFLIASPKKGEVFSFIQTHLAPTIPVVPTRISSLDALERTKGNDLRRLLGEFVASTR